MKPPPFEYEGPRTADEAVARLAQHGDRAKVLAGGQRLVPLLNFRLAQPDVLVDVNRVAELAYSAAKLSKLQPHKHGRHVRAGRLRHDRRVELHLAPVCCELPSDLRIRLEIHDRPHAVVLEREVQHAFYQ